MIYTVDAARQLIADGWFISLQDGELFWLVRGDDRVRLYRNVALYLMGCPS